LTQAQLESLAMMAAGTIWILVVRNRYGSLARPADQLTVPDAAAQRA
jgi:hypothetical protein